VRDTNRIRLAGPLEAGVGTACDGIGSKDWHYGKQQGNGKWHVFLHGLSFCCFSTAVDSCRLPSAAFDLNPDL
jgi:hypothetical protein